MKVIREMLVKVETEQQAHLDQLSKMEDATKYIIMLSVGFPPQKWNLSICMYGCYFGLCNRCMAEALYCTNK